MKTTAQLKPLSKGKRKYIYVYFQSKGNLIRVNTGNEYQSSYVKSDGFYNSAKKDYEKLNDEMSALLSKANEYIKFCLENDKKMNNKDCKSYMFSKWSFTSNDETKTDHNDKPKEGLFAMDYYNDFYSYKEAELQNKYSLKDYKSLQNSLLDFERDNGRFTFSDMNGKEWLFRFRDYLAEKRPNESHLDKSKRVYLSEGGLSDTTINKRIQTLKNWFLWIMNNDLYSFSNEVMRYNVKKGQQEIITLSLDELKALYNFDEYDKKERLVIDVFVFNCLTGLRYGDLSTLDKDLFNEIDGNLFYTKYNQKTNVEINVPILPLAKEILERYNWNIRVYANPVLNRRIKEILKKYNLLETPVYKNEKRGGKIHKYKLLKREAVTTHTARKTYITNAKLLGIPDNVIMSSTGHKSLTIMQKYAKKVADYKAFEAMSF